MKYLEHQKIQHTCGWHVDIYSHLCRGGLSVTMNFVLEGCPAIVDYVYSKQWLVWSMNIKYNISLFVHGDWLIEHLFSVITDNVQNKISTCKIPLLFQNTITFSLFLSIFYISQRLTLWYFVFLYLIFLSQQVLYFLLSTLVLTLYIDVVLSLSITQSMVKHISDDKIM